ncbi:helix-turn-helix domain-containing protein [Pedobacter duraquae]|uniref:HTH-type transcriptional regulator/antitoxin HigA n=1 Tax=Pedobacter duraquae TaxID=425511 RepID=A0A4R6IBW8_9SPHI|nr:XRE family transcriptional regulator [Pedobacter duraquae]TDO19081.1 HTH-type transcriptional regulator/antitoxin HigA [Pedobacter duraquae]
MGNTKHQWFLIENEAEYENAMARYAEVKHAVKGTEDHREKMLLVHLISTYEKATSTLPEVDPITFIKIRMSDFGYKSADLAKLYGDKGTVSKVLNYKQSLSITMIRKFSMLLNIPVESLIKEYSLKDIQQPDQA